MTETIETQEVAPETAAVVAALAVVEQPTALPAVEVIKVQAKDVVKQNITFVVSPYLLTPNRENVRFSEPTEARLKELATSMAENGQIEPIRVERLNGSALGIVTGTTRWMAVKYGIENGILPEDFKIRYELVDIKDAAARRRMNVAENVHRNNLSPIELAMAFDDFVTKDGMTQKEAAAELGKKNAWGNAAKYLLQLPPKYKEMVHTGAMTAELGYEIMMAPEGKADIILKTIKTKGLPLNRVNFRAELREMSDAELPPADAETTEALAGDSTTEDPEGKIVAVKKAATGRKKKGNKATKRSVADQHKYWSARYGDDSGENAHVQAVAKIMDEFVLGKCSDKRMTAFLATVKVAKPKAE